LRRCPGPCYDERSSQGKNDTHFPDFEEIDALLSLIEFHDDWEEVSARVGTDVDALYEKLSEMQDEV